MKEISDELYFLSQDELIVLLSTKGVDQIYLLNNGDVSLEEKEILYAVSHLFQNQFIEGSNDKFRICEPLNTMLVNLCNASKLLILRRLNQGVESICAYQCGEDYVVLRWNEQRRNRIEISSHDIQDLKDVFKEYMSFEREYAPVLEAEESLRHITDDTKPIGAESLHRFHNIPIMLEKIELETKKVKEKVFVQIKENETVIVCKTKEQLEVVDYKEEALHSRMEVLLGVNEK